MQLAKRLPLLVLLVGHLPAQTISYETFEYPVGGLDGRDGGLGWAEPWNAFGSLVVPPSLDGIGRSARVDPANGSATCWRAPDPFDWTHLVDNGRFGLDGTSLFLRFRIRRSPGSQSEYGGLTLYEVNTPSLFIGAPWGINRWGIEDHVGGQTSLAVNSGLPGPALLVLLLDFQPGQERARLWVDPPAFPPGGVPDVDVLVGDMRFTRMRLAAGTTTPGSFDFDEIILRDAVGPILGWRYCGPAVPNTTGVGAEIGALGSDLRAQNNLALWASNMPTQQFGIFLVSANRGLVPGAGGSQGVLCLGGPIGRFNAPNQLQNSGSNGRFSLALDLGSFPGPGGTFSVQAGETWHFQGWYRDFLPGIGATSNFTPGLSVVFQ